MHTRYGKPKSWVRGRPRPHADTAG